MVGVHKSYHSLPLLPYQLRFCGYVMVLFSLGALYLYFFGGRPSIFETPVFAIVTSYTATRWFVVAQTNALDEVAVICAVLGLLFILFSKQKFENEAVQIIRIKSLFFSVYFTSALIIIFYLFVFGWPVFILLSLSLIIFLLISIIWLKISLWSCFKTTSIKKVGEL